jgi:hypothetical protein
MPSYTISGFPESYCAETVGYLRAGVVSAFNFSIA